MLGGAHPFSITGLSLCLISGLAIAGPLLPSAVELYSVSALSCGCFGKNGWLKLDSASGTHPSTVQYLSPCQRQLKYKPRDYSVRQIKSYVSLSIAANQTFFFFCYSSVYSKWNLIGCYGLLHKIIVGCRAFDLLESLCLFFMCYRL